MRRWVDGGDRGAACDIPHAAPRRTERRSPRRGDHILSLSLSLVSSHPRRAHFGRELKIGPFSRIHVAYTSILTRQVPPCGVSGNESRGKGLFSPLFSTGLTYWRERWRAPAVFSAPPDSSASRLDIGTVLLLRRWYAPLPATVSGIGTASECRRGGVCDT